jgi:hypothetical protein
MKGIYLDPTIVENTKKDLRLQKDRGQNLGEEAPNSRYKRVQLCNISTLAKEVEDGIIVPFYNKMKAPMISQQLLLFPIGSW